jgi:phosphoadenosine phosphosulfate reductase
MCTLLNAMFREDRVCCTGGSNFICCNAREDDVKRLLRDQLEKTAVYWLNPGDTPPETLAVVHEVRQWIPHFIEVTTDVKGWRQTNGYPTDLLPANSHFIGVLHGLGDLQLTNRFDCCFHNIMSPLHQRMVDDGVDAVIRGTKLCDGGKVPAEGPTPFYEVLLPVRNWTHLQVFEYLEKVGAPKNAIYDHFRDISAPECMGCTAWWGDGKAQYFLERHPGHVAQYRANLQTLADAAHAQLAELYAELHTLTKGR